MTSSDRKEKTRQGWWVDGKTPYNKSKNNSAFSRQRRRNNSTIF